MWNAMREYPQEVRWLLIAGFFFNLAFYMLIPYLAWHLRENLLLSTGMIGLLLGARHISQQGLFILGGYLADNYGSKKLLLWGCWLRVASLILLALGEHILVVTIAVLLTGFSGALFTPAAQALLAAQARVSGHAIFALASVFRSAGELGGPLIGVLLLKFDFSYLCFAAALPFAWFGFTLKGKKQTSTPPSNHPLAFWESVKTVLQKRAFIVFCITMSGYFILVNQLYFILPLALQQRGGSTTWISVLFFSSAAIGVTMQMWLSRWCESRWHPSRIIEYGFIIMATAFLLPLIDAPFSHQLDLLLLLGSGLMLTVGMLMCYPVIMQQVAHFGSQTDTATHYGVFYLFAGIGMALGNTVLGLLADAVSEFSVHFYAWLFLIVLGVVTALSVRYQAKHYDTRAELSHA